MEIWNASSLAQALPAESFSSVVVNDHALKVQLKDHADLEVAIVISDKYVTAQAVLCPVAAVEAVTDVDEFNKGLLFATKALHLSSFAIETINDVECYVILAEFTSSTIIENVLIELNTLAENAFEVSTEISNKQA